MIRACTSSSTMKLVQLLSPFDEQSVLSSLLGTGVSLYGRKHGSRTIVIGMTVKLDDNFDTMKYIASELQLHTSSSIS